MTQPQVLSQTEQVPSAQNTQRQSLIPKIVTRQVPLYLDPYLQPPPSLPDLKENRRNLTDLNMDNDINIDFEENSPHQEGIITEHIKEQIIPMLKNNQSWVIYLMQGS